MTNRPLIRVLNSEAVTDGDGVKINRSVARGALQAFDPFLMLDEMAGNEAADYVGGFPEHPHRGFETVTYMLEGSMQHRDHMGNVGTLESGGVQWMTAGRGVLHSEMPLQDEGRLHGFQLWVNLPASEKMSEPAYREYDRQQIPVLNFGAGSSLKAIAGKLSLDGESIKGPVAEVVTQPDFFDVVLAAGDTITIPLAAHKLAMLYVYQGQLTIEDRTLASQQLGMLGDGEQLRLTTETGARLLVLAGTPIGEPIANYGPFVMNTREEIEQAIQDYRDGRLVTMNQSA